VQRATECNAALREAGKVYGHVPYGCVAIGQGEGRVQLRDPVNWPRRDAIVARLREGASLRTVRRELAGQGLLSPTGKAQWSLNTLRELVVHHDVLASLPMAEGDQLAALRDSTPDPEVSAHA
jgi:hypothetical protein